MEYCCNDVIGLVISIHAPREGGDGTPYIIHATIEISIHAPREGGDYRLVHFLTAKMPFQSTPPARGATANNKTVAESLKISIHAPREGGDPLHPLLAVCAVQISIHAPREGGDDIKIPFFTPAGYFNPRPPRGGRQQRCTVLPADL